MSKDLYKKAGVDIEKGNKAVNMIKDMVTEMGIKEIGKFSGFFPLKENFNNPVLVSSADGVGTKLKIAFLMEVHNTVGRDLVNHCVNDILVYGAKPLYFLDYIATGKLQPQVITSVVGGILEGCLENEFVLLGGETAEMPGFYKDNEYDIAGFIVGLVEKDKIIDGRNIEKGDLLIGLPSTGLHTNGYSLAREIIFKKLKLKVTDTPEGFSRTIGEELLTVHRSYSAPVKALMAKNLLKAMAHITGGGLTDNIPRVLPDNFMVQIERIWPIPPIFQFLIKSGKVSKSEQFRVFNMGIGFVLIVNKKNLSRVEKILKSLNEKYYLIGQVKERKDNIKIKIN